MSARESIPFDHRHAAHCESGAFAALLRHAGLTLSEPMVFGIGSGLFFLYLPFLKIYDAPLVAYRDRPNAIIDRASKRLGVRLARARYRDEAAAMRALDADLARGVPVGMQTGVFWLPYFPRDMRFQFNGHHVIAFGRDGDDYLLSDTVFESVVRCPADDLRRARFSKGPLAPNGLAYHVAGRSQDVDLPQAVRIGLKSTASRMLGVPLPWMGLRGIRTLAASMREWPTKRGDDVARTWLAGTIRMQEEIGTGGGGFRFMYAAFLDEAAALLRIDALREASAQLTEVGDGWRDFAVEGAKLIRAERAPLDAWRSLAARIDACADGEAAAFGLIKRVV